MWTRSKIEWTKGDPTYTTPVLAKAINEVNENANAADEIAQEAKNLSDTAIEDAKKALDDATAA